MPTGIPITPRANGRKRKMARNTGRRGPAVKNHENGATSIIERTRVPLGPMRRRAMAAKGQSRNLDFEMQPQQHSNWCWAAVATSVAHFYNRNSKWTQCRVANRNLGKKGCCEGLGRKCNKIGHLQDSLKLVGHSEPPRFIEGKIPFRRAQHEINARRPVGVRTQWRGSEIGHYIAIVGYHSGLKMLTVEDPTYGTSHVHYRVFCRDYRGSGKWTRSYCTRSEQDAHAAAGR
jgi:Papain-like cysteine protease AvrRpt2